MVKKTHKNRNLKKGRPNIKKINSIKPVNANKLSKSLKKIINDTIKKRLSTFKITRKKRFDKSHKKQNGGTIDEEDAEKLYESIKGDLEEHINEGIGEIESSIEDKITSGIEEIDSTVQEKIANAFEEMEGIIQDKISGGIDEIMDEVIPNLTNLIYHNQEQLVSKIEASMRTNTGQIKNYVDRIFNQFNEDIVEHGDKLNELHKNYNELGSETGKEFIRVNNQLKIYDRNLNTAHNAFEFLKNKVNKNEQETINDLNNLNKKINKCCP